MKVFKGTKGEWKYELCNGRIRFKKPNMDLWFKDEDNGFKERPSEVLANAKLIAAAPELLESLQRLVSGYKHFENLFNDFDRERLKSAEKAITKALK